MSTHQMAKSLPGSTTCRSSIICLMQKTAPVGSSITTMILLIVLIWDWLSWPNTASLWDVTLLLIPHGFLWCFACSPSWSCYWKELDLSYEETCKVQQPSCNLFQKRFSWKATNNVQTTGRSLCDPKEGMVEGIMVSDLCFPAKGQVQFKQTSYTCFLSQSQVQFEKTLYTCISNQLSVVQSDYMYIN